MVGRPKLPNQVLDDQNGRPKLPNHGRPKFGRPKMNVQSCQIKFWRSRPKVAKSFGGAKSSLDDQFYFGGAAKSFFGGAKSNLDEMVGPLRVGKGRVGKQQSMRKTEAKQVELRTILYWNCGRKLTNRSKATEEGGNEFVMLNHRGEGENPPPNVMTINC